MMFGLPVSTFFLVFVFPLICVGFAVIYGITFKEGDKWWTVDQFFESPKTKTEEEDVNGK